MLLLFQDNEISPETKHLNVLISLFGIFSHTCKCTLLCKFQFIIIGIFVGIKIYLTKPNVLSFFIIV